MPNGVGISFDELDFVFFDDSLLPKLLQLQQSDCSDSADAASGVSRLLQDYFGKKALLSTELCKKITKFIQFEQAAQIYIIHRLGRAEIESGSIQNTGDAINVLAELLLRAMKYCIAEQQSFWISSEESAVAVQYDPTSLLMRAILNREPLCDVKSIQLPTQIQESPSAEDEWAVDINYEFQAGARKANLLDLYTRLMHDQQATLLGCCTTAGDTRAVLQQAICLLVLLGRIGVQVYQGQSQLKTLHTLEQAVIQICCQLSNHKIVPQTDGDAGEQVQESAQDAVILQ